MRDGSSSPFSETEADQQLGLARRRLLLGLVVLPTLATAPAASAAEEPVAVLELASLAQPWAAAQFTFELNGERVPGIVIRLPGERWYASSLVCPHAKCIVRYFTDVEAARDTFDAPVKNPVLGCPCHFSVFDVADGGKVIAGPAPNPPLQLSVDVREGKVFVRR